MKSLIEYIFEAKWDVSIETLQKDGWQPLIKSRGAGQKRYVWWKPSYYQLWTKDNKYVIVKTNGQTFNIEGDGSKDISQWQTALLTTSYNTISDDETVTPKTIDKPTGEAPDKTPKIKSPKPEYKFTKSGEGCMRCYKNTFSCQPYKDRPYQWNEYYTISIKDDKIYMLNHREKYDSWKGIMKENIKEWHWDTPEAAKMAIYGLPIGQKEYEVVSYSDTPTEIKKLKYVSLIGCIDVLAKINNLDKQTVAAWNKASTQEKVKMTIDEITNPSARWVTDSDYDDYPWYWCRCGKFGGWFNPTTQSFEESNKSDLPNDVYELVRTNPQVIKTAMGYRRK